MAETAQMNSQPSTFYSIPYTLMAYLDSFCHFVDEIVSIGPL